MAPVNTTRECRSGTSMSGSASTGGVAPESARSFRRLIHTVDSPFALAGAMSWNRLCATCRISFSGTPACWIRYSKFLGDGLYELICCAVKTWSNSTPRISCEYRNRSSSILERMMSWYRVANACRASEESGKAGQFITEVEKLSSSSLDGSNPYTSPNLNRTACKTSR